MRKIYFLLILLSAGSAAFAQNYPVSRPLHLKPVTLVPAKKHLPMQPNDISTPITVDYTDAEFQYYTGEGNNDYHAFTNIGTINAAYSNNFVGYRYLYASVDSLYDLNTGLSYQKSDVSSITVDSFTVYVNHTNGSGTANTFYAEIVSLNAKGFPTNNVLWEDSLTTDTSLGSFIPVTFKPAFMVADNHYAYRFDFKGDTGLDVFTVIVGCHAPVSTQGVCNGFNICDSLSHFYPNSYGYILEGIDQLLPNSSGGFLFEDCNSNGVFDSTVDGRDYLQDLYVISDITLNTITGVKAQPNVIDNLKIYPNPAQNQATISYSLPRNAKVSVSISDAMGRIVKQYPQMEQSTGRNQFKTDLSSLDQGLYFVHLMVNGKDASVNKLSVSRN